MGIVSTGSFAKDLWPGVNKWYGIKYKEYPIEHNMIFDTEKSTKAFEEDVGAAMFGLAPIKTEGGSISYDEAKQAYIDRYTHITYALGFIITREMHDDGISATVALRRAKALAFSIRQTIETVAANVLNRAFTNTYTFGDGVELCSTAHPNITGGTWRNELATAADLSEASLEQACIDIADFKTDRRILKSVLRPDTANNDINALRSTGVIPEFAVNHYLTDVDAWFLKTDCPDGMKHFSRRAPEFDTDNDFDTENARFKATTRDSFGATDKRGIFGSPGA
jgi:hypothetical protein